MMAHFVVRQTQWMQHDSCIDVLLKYPSVTILLWDDLVALAIGEANTGCPRHLGSLTFSLTSSSTAHLELQDLCPTTTGEASSPRALTSLDVDLGRLTDYHSNN